MLSVQPQTILSRSFEISPNVAPFTLQIYIFFDKTSKKYYKLSLNMLNTFGVFIQSQAFL